MRTLLTTLFCLALAFPVLAEKAPTNLTYTMTIEGKEIGGFTVKRQKAKVGEKDGIKQVAKITMKQMGMEISSDSTLEIVDGVTMGYNLSMNLMGQDARLTATRADGKMTIENSMPMAQGGSFATSKYDFTTAVFGEYGQMAEMKAGEEKSFKVLHIEEGRILPVAYKLLKSETVEVDGKKLECKVFEHSSDMKSGKRWLAKDALGVFLVKEQGGDSKAKGEVALTSLK